MPIDADTSQRNGLRAGSLPVRDEARTVLNLLHAPVSGVTATDANVPYWWIAAPPITTTVEDLDGRHYDVAIVGSGITGLRTALDLARAGKRVLVLDRDVAGFGASTRAAGFLGCALKRSFAEMAAQEGREIAYRVCTELRAAIDRTLRFIETEGIHCFADRCGRFIAANSRAHFHALTAQCEEYRRAVGWDFEVVSKADLHREMGTQAYEGGVVVPFTGSLHPGLYHRGLLERVLAAGAAVATRSEVEQVVPKNSEYEVVTRRGRVRAAHVVVATNGYTPRNFPFIARRVIPFTGYIAATEELPEDLLAELLPRRRTVLDTKTNIDFFRRAPDSPRLMVGGATGYALSGRAQIAARLGSILRRVYPQLEAVEFKSVWSGRCAATFDMLPHVARHEGIWYAGGYNFVGIPTGTLFGELIAARILGQEAPSVFADVQFRSAPLYRGNAWFVPLVMRYYDYRDRRLALRG
jgi:glycine/D-amino acid oxidase-like deaminating enzyme